LVAAQNDLMALAARKVFQSVSDLSERDRWMALPFIGVDGLPKTGQAWVRDGLMTATVIMPPCAGHALTLMMDGLAKQKPIPKKCGSPTQPSPPLDQLQPANTSPE